MISAADLHQANRAAWNEAAEYYESKTAADIVFLREGGTSFLEPERQFLQELNKWCGRAIHLQCAAGRDTLSLWNLGAREVIGIDLSDRMIAAAGQKSEALNAPAKWFCCDLMQTPGELDGTADLVYTGRGALCWIMDICGWARTVARLLKPGGRLYLFEGHPLDWVWDPAASELKIDPSGPYGDYFSQEVSVEKGWPETYIPAKSIAPKAQLNSSRSRQWTLGQIINALADTGLQLVRLEEYPDLFWNAFPNVDADTVRRLPHTFSLLMRKA